MRPTNCPVYAGYCRNHGFTHGAEAEELREGIEMLIAGADDSVDSDARVVSVADLRCLLNKIDARDSLAFCETPNDRRAAPKKRTHAKRP